MGEKIVRSLHDLEEALAMAAREGGCRIRVGERVAALVVSEDVSDEAAERFLTHPSITDRLSKATSSLNEGRGIPHQKVLQRFGHKKV